MEHQVLLNFFLAKAREENNVHKSHICLLLAIYHQWQNGGYKNPVNITRKKLMSIAQIKSLATYHRCISELDELGYLQYRPSYHPKGSYIYWPDISLK